MIYYVRTVMEIKIEADNESKAKDKAIESFKGLNNWIPIRPLEIINEHSDLFSTVDETAIAMKYYLKNKNLL